MRRYLLCFVSLLLLFVLFGSHRLEAASPSVLYLTWLHDPTTTMTIHWHTTDHTPQTVVYYRQQEKKKWLEAKGISSLVPKTNLLVHTVELDGLNPDSKYEFRVEKKGETYRFKTLPSSLSHPVRFVIGGDAYHQLDRFGKMNCQIAKYSPDFVVIGGDIAYTNGMRLFFKSRSWEVRRWRKFFKEWKKQLVTEDGRLIPLIPVLGNHDMRGSSLHSREQRPLFYEFFPLPNKLSYRVLDFGNYLSLILLDTGHSFNIQGRQTTWLGEQLKERVKMSYKFAIYHISAYPSAYAYQGTVPTQIRKQWCPLFDQYQLTAAFENHNHAYKRTFPLKGGKIDPTGVIYIGDGSWGVRPREPKELWYLAKKAKVNAICLITLRETSASIEALSSKGKIFDAVFIEPTAQEAELTAQ